MAGTCLAQSDSRLLHVAAGLLNQDAEY